MKFNAEYLLFEKLQDDIKLIVQGCYDKIENLNGRLTSTVNENEQLITKNAALNSLIEDLQSRLKSTKCPNCKPVINNENADVSDLKRTIFRGSQAEFNIQQEIEEVSSLHLDTQFIPDESPTFIQESPPAEPAPSKLSDLSPQRSVTTRSILNELFGARSSSPKQSTEADVELAAASPQRPILEYNGNCFVPETMTMNETTPQKKFTMLPPTSAATSRRQLLTESAEKEEAPSVKPDSIRLTPLSKLMEKKSPLLTFSQLISPSKPLPSKRLLSTPKRKPSPLKSLGKITPRKKILKRNHKNDLEISHNGVKKLQQSQLNMAYFAVDKNDSIIMASPEKFEPDEIENLPGTSRQTSPTVKPQSPLNTSHLQNSPDMNETHLSASALKRLGIVEDVEGKNIEPKEELISSYDRIPDVPDDIADPRSKEARKRLPGQVCLDCVRWYDDFGPGDQEQRQKLIDMCSRHRTRRIELPETPDGFWKPVMSPTQKSPTSSRHPR